MYRHISLDASSRNKIANIHFDTAQYANESHRLCFDSIVVVVVDADADAPLLMRMQ